MIYELGKTVRGNKDLFGLILSGVVLNHYSHRALLHVEHGKYSKLPVPVALSLLALGGIAYSLRSMSKSEGYELAP